MEYIGLTYRNSFCQVAFILAFLFSCRGHRNNKIESIEYASFRPIATKDSVDILLYAKISPGGRIAVFQNDPYHKRRMYYTYYLNDSQIENIDQVFDGGPLKKYLVATGLDSNTNYAGNYDFFYITYSNGKMDSLVFIEPFISPYFDSTYKMLDEIYYEKNDTGSIPHFAIPATFFESMLKSYRKAEYLPEIKTPGAFIN